MDTSNSTEVTTTGIVGAPDIWNPIKDDLAPNPLVAEVLTYDSISTDFGERATVIMREDDTDRTWSLMIAGTALEGQFALRKPMPGETIRVEYRGTAVSQSGKFQGKEYHRWDVRVRRPAQVPDWHALEGGEVKLLDSQAEQVIEAEVEIDAEGLPPARSLAERAEQAYGDDVPFD